MAPLSVFCRVFLSRVLFPTVVSKLEFALPCLMACALVRGTFPDDIPASCLGGEGRNARRQGGGVVDDRQPTLLESLQPCFADATLICGSWPSAKKDLTIELFLIRPRLRAFHPMVCDIMHVRVSFNVHTLCLLPSTGRPFPRHLTSGPRLGDASWKELVAGVAGA